MMSSFDNHCSSIYFYALLDIKKITSKLWGASTVFGVHQSMSTQMVDIDMGAGQKCSGARGSSRDPPRKLGRLWSGLGLGFRGLSYGGLLPNPNPNPYPYPYPYPPNPNPNPNPSPNPNPHNPDLRRHRGER